MEELNPAHERIKLLIFVCERNRGSRFYRRLGPEYRAELTAIRWGRSKTISFDLACRIKEVYPWISLSWIRPAPACKTL